MRRAPAFVWPQNNGNLCDARADLRRLDDHLQREFHPRTAQVQPVVETTGESPHSAVTVSNARMKLSIAVRPGLPKYLCSGDMAPGLIPPLKRFPITMSLPSRSFSTNFGTSVKS